MFTNKKAKYYGDNKVLLDSACLSSDTKPTTGVANGSKCIEMDTGKTYMFNEEDSEWEELPSSGGGGGSSDFSTAQVTIVNNSGGPAALNAPLIVEDEGEFFAMNKSIFNGELTLAIVLYKGTSAEGIYIDAMSDNITVTGNATYEDQRLVITGDCTITIS